MVLLSVTPGSPAPDEGQLCFLEGSSGEARTEGGCAEVPPKEKTVSSDLQGFIEGTLCTQRRLCLPRWAGVGRRGRQILKKAKP